MQRETPWRGSLSGAVEPERNFMWLFPKPSQSTSCVTCMALLAQGLNVLCCAVLSHSVISDSLQPHGQ